MKRWVRRAAGAAALLLGLDIVLTLFDFAPDHLRLALLVALAVAVTGLLTDSLGEDAPVWRVEPMGTGGRHRDRSPPRVVRPHPREPPDRAHRRRRAPRPAWRLSATSAWRAGTR